MHSDPTFPISSKNELRRLSRIALPLTAAYLAEFLMFITTKMVVGKLGYHELAAVGIASALSFEVLVIMMGLLSIVGVLCAQAEGGGQKRQAGLVVQQGFFVSTLIGIPSMVIVWNLDTVLAWTGQDPLIVELAGPYLRQLSGFVLAVLFFSVLRNFVSAISRPKVVMFITVGGVAVNYLLTEILVHGRLGMPAMGLAGAGLATNIVSWLMFFLLLAHLYITPALRGYGIFSGRWKIDPAVCREILTLGLPVAGLVVLEAGLFVATSILSGNISAETLAAHEIVMAWVGIPFVIGLGIAEATMVRVAHGAGRGNLLLARKSGLVGMVSGSVTLAVLVVIPVGFAPYIIGIFISGQDPGFAAVSVLATQFLFIGAIFQVFDGLQAVAARALRGLKDSVAPLWIAAFGYWILGIGGGTFLAFVMNLQGAGLWWGLAIGLATTGSLLAWRFHRLSAYRIAASQA